MKKALILFSLIALNSQNISAQNLRFGGNFGVNFGSNQTSIQISPEVSKRVSKIIELGANLNYRYNSANNYSENIYGAGVFVRPHIMDALYTHLGFNMNYRNFSQGNTYDRWVNSLLLGAGYKQQIGSNTVAHFGLVYDLLYDKEYSLNSSAFTPMGGISVGF